MQYDYYAFRKKQLENSLSELEQASSELEQAKKQKNNKDERKQAEKKVEQAAAKAVQIEPHLSYLWYEAQGSELKNPLREAWQKCLTDNSIPSEFQFLPKLSDLANLPSLSFMLRIPFKLRKPYLSKDDRAFHLLDNPVRKDRLFQTPMVASTGWKGALHSAMLQQLAEWWCNIDDKTSRTHRKELLARRISIARLFGTEKGIDIDDRKLESYLDSLSDDYLARWYRRCIRRYIASSGFFAGRLYFYPTFFDKIGLEVINPHDRKKGTGKNPILIECVPGGKNGATGEFVILYVPFGKVEESEVAADLKLVVEGVQAMLTVYGFGAKTSSGFGVADIEGKGELAIRAALPDLAKASSPEQKPEFLDDDGSLKREFLDDDGKLKSQGQYKKFCQKQGKTYNEKLYKEVKAWVGAKEQRQLEFTVTKSVSQKTFVSWSELGDRVQQIADQLCRKQMSSGGQP
ncbi:MAG: RAMP superfamily CRISPR-associated protein [Cyanobacteriota bacterium]